MREPRLLVVSPRYAPDFYGPAAQVHQINVGLRRLGVEVLVLTAGTRPASDAVDDVLITAVAACAPARQGRATGLLVETARQIGRMWAIRNRFDVAYILDYKYQAALLAVAARLLGRKVVIRRSIDTQPGSRSVPRRIRDWIRDRCTDAVVAVSPGIHQEVLAQRSRPAHVVYVANGVNPGRFRPPADRVERERVRSELGLPERGFIAICVGAVHPRKGTLDVVRAWTMAVDRDAEGVLVLIGPCRDPRYEEEIIRLAHDHGAGERVVFHGEQADVARYYRAANVFLFASNREGMPNAVLEALSAGLPVVARGLPVLRQLLADGRGYIVEGRGSEVAQRMADTIREVMADPDAASRRGESGRRYAITYHSTDEAVRGHLDVFRHVCGFSWHGEKRTVWN
jgi:glycosyltransferase involved in cell wall biosynthesis